MVIFFVLVHCIFYVIRRRRLELGEEYDEENKEKNTIIQLQDA